VDYSEGSASRHIEVRVAGRMTFLWFIAAISYILTLPTILDLMTGYAATSTAIGPSADGDLVPLNLSEIQQPGSQYYNDNGWIYGADAVTCVPSQAYQWRFSSGWIALAAISTSVWCWGMFGVWFDAQKNSILWRVGRRSGAYRDILDISNALQEALGPDTCAYSDAELTKEIKKMGPVEFEAVCDGSTGYVALCHEPCGCAALANAVLSMEGRHSKVLRNCPIAMFGLQNRS
jgi:hypothetical protein